MMTLQAARPLSFPPRERHIIDKLPVACSLEINRMGLWPSLAMLVALTLLERKWFRMECDMFCVSADPLGQWRLYPIVESLPSPLHL